MSAVYTHLGPDWPAYRWDNGSFATDLAKLHFRRGQLVASMATLGFEVRREAVLQVLIQDVTKSSEIEGDKLDAAQVRSSIARRLGMECAGLPNPERRVDGVVEMMLDATQRFQAPLDEQRIFGWHASLFPTGWSGMQKIMVGAWRDDANGPMQVVSGPIGNERVHFEAPSADRIPLEMARFLHWFESTGIDPVLKAAIAHLWFVTIHPMDDGNGRIGRAIMDMALARADGTGQRFYSMTAQIHADKNAYYDVLERAQKSSMDITAWIHWFFSQMKSALASAESVVEVVQKKQAFWDAHRDSNLNLRQAKILNMLFDGFYGKLQSTKYGTLAKCSHDTALRDLADLVGKGILIQEGSGRSTSYVLAV